MRRSLRPRSGKCGELQFDACRTGYNTVLGERGAPLVGRSEVNAYLAG